MHDASPLLLSLVIVAAGLAGGIAPFFFQWSHRTAHRWIAFGAGTVLGVAFLHMIPEAVELASRSAVPMMLLGFVTLYAIEQLSLRHPHEEDEGEFHEIGLLAFLGLTIHDLVDGIALGGGAHIPELTPAIFVALILHKIPTTFAFSVLLLHGDYKRGRIFAFLLVLLVAIPAGVLVSQILAQHLHGSVWIGRLIGFSAGTFIYIGAYELLPEMHRKSREDSFIGAYFVGGLALLFLLKWLHPVF